MDLALDIASWALLLSGSAFCVIGGIGLIRMPDLYSRSHAAGLADTLGAALILFGLALQSEAAIVTIKLFLVLAFLYVTSPTASHALLKAAYAKGVRAPDIEDESATTGDPGGTAP
jgi:multicomponent Na+:H+ antiporter subunit G